VAAVATLAVLVLGPVAAPAPVAADAIHDKQAEAAALAHKIDDLDQRVSILAEKVDQARAQATRTALGVADATKALGQADDAASGAQRQLVNQAVTTYVKGGRPNLVATDGADPAVVAAYQRVLSGSETDILDAMKAALVRSREKKVDLERARKSADQALADVQGRQRAAAQADRDLKGALDRVRGDLTVLVAQEQSRQAAARLAAVQAQIAAAQQARSQSALFASPPPVGGGAGAAVAAARAELGKPYVWGAAGPGAFDCSGLTMWAWRAGGVSLPHQSGQQYAQIPHVSPAVIQPGDLLFYGSPIHHVGIYIGGGQMIDAPHSGANVRIESIGFDGHLVGAGRP
jgi:cell wall-associated NlpC family hydrolase